MPKTPTTPASVASRLTDEEILELAKIAEEAFCNEYKIAAVLRDYVRLRSHKLRMIKPHLCTECSHWSDSGCEVGGCADFNEKGETK